MRTGVTPVCNQLMYLGPQLTHSFMINVRSLLSDYLLVIHLLLPAHVGHSRQPRKDLCRNLASAKGCNRQSKAKRFKKFTCWNLVEVACVAANTTGQRMSRWVCMPHWWVGDCQQMSSCSSHKDCDLGPLTIFTQLSHSVNLTLAGHTHIHTNTLPVVCSTSLGESDDKNNSSNKNNKYNNNNNSDNNDDNDDNNGNSLQGKSEMEVLYNAGSLVGWLVVAQSLNVEKCCNITYQPTQLLACTTPPYLTFPVSYSDYYRHYCYLLNLHMTI